MSDAMTKYGNLKEQVFKNTNRLNQISWEILTLQQERRELRDANADIRPRMSKAKKEMERENKPAKPRKASTKRPRAKSGASRYG